MLTLACIIVHFGQDKYLRQCLESLKKVEKENFEVEIIVVDNNKKNLGFAGGANKGIKKALKNKNTQYIFLLNNDTIVEKKALTKLLKTAKKNNVGIVGPKILSTQATLESLGGTLDKNRFSAILINPIHPISPIKPINLDFISGTAMFIKRAVFEKIPSFDERFFLYYEDVDFCLRARKAGFRLAVNPKAIVYHHHSASTGQNSSLKQYYLARNHLLLVEKHAPLKIKLRELLRLPKTLLEHYQKKLRSLLLKAVLV